MYRCFHLNPSEEFMEELLKVDGVDFGPTSTGSFPIHSAALNGHLEVLKLLLEAGADVKARNDLNITSVHLAVANDRLDMLKELFKHGADLNAQDADWGFTPLIIATATRSSRAIVK